MSVAVHHGDSREVLKEFEDASFDSCITDPPYFLTSIVKRFGAQNAAAAQYGADGRFARLSGGFMNQAWDAPPPPVIDPGFAHWFAGFVDGEGCFSVHKKTVNGCETFDCQFSLQLRADDAPIIHDIQRQLGGIGSIALRDKKSPSTSANAKPQVRYCISSKADCLKLREIFRVFPLRAKKARDFEIWAHALDAWVAHKPSESWEDIAYYRDALMAVRNFGSVHRPERLFFYSIGRELLRVLKPGGHLLMFSGTRTYHHMVCGIEDAGFEVRDTISWVYGQGFPKSHSVEKATKDPAHAGMGTALKPAMELILVARKPLAGTVAANVMKHGTGALNIDGCRIASTDDTSRPSGGALGIMNDDGWRPQIGMITGGGEGRWPANVVHDGSEEVLACFPESAGQQGVIKGTESSNSFGGSTYSGPKARVGGYEPRADNGSAARFFYTAKADSDDRLGSKHPTVKPVDLMRWLCRLVTPPGGLVLDPFAGSGTTGMACMAEGFKATLIEREAQYVADIKHRIAHVKGEDAPLFAGTAA